MHWNVLCLELDCSTSGQGVWWSNMAARVGFWVIFATNRSKLTPFYCIRWPEYGLVQVQQQNPSKSFLRGGQKTAHLPLFYTLFTASRINQAKIPTVKMQHIIPCNHFHMLMVPFMLWLYFHPFSQSNISTKMVNTGQMSKLVSH